MTPPTAEGGALRSQDLRTPADPTTLDGAIIRVEPRHRRGAAGQPERRERGPERAPHHRLRPAQPVPLHVPARDQRDLRRRRGLERLGGDRPDRRARPRRSRTSAGRATRAPAAQAAYDDLNLNLCENLYAAGAGSGHRAALHLQPLRQGRRRESCPHRRLVDLRPRVLRRRHLPGAVQRRALLRRLRAQLHLGDVPRRRTACPTRPRAAVRQRTPAARSTSRSAPAATSSTSTSSSGTIQRIQRSSSNHAPTAHASARRPRAGRCRCR